MNKKSLRSGLYRVLKIAQSLNQISTASEIQALRDKISSAYYFEVQPGGYGKQIPDKEYEEFDTKEEVIQYVADHLYGEGAGYTPEQQQEVFDALTYEDARAALMEIGEYGEIGEPVLPPDALVGSEEPKDSSFYKEVLVEVPPRDPKKRPKS